jgi:ribonuclease-3
VSEIGPAHRRRFEVEVLVHGHALAKAEGRSKKEAAQAAAKAALARLTEEGFWLEQPKAEGQE